MGSLSGRSEMLVHFLITTGLHSTLLLIIDPCHDYIISFLRIIDRTLVVKDVQLTLILFLIG